MEMDRRAVLGAAAALGASRTEAAVPDKTSPLDLAARVARIEDADAVRALHFKYGYYMDASAFEDIVELFADDCEIHFLGGVYRGKAGARRLYVQRLGADRNRAGRLHDHLMMQDIVDVAPDGRTAKARFRCFMQAGVHVSRNDLANAGVQTWQSGIYENQYEKIGGVWRVKLFNYMLIWEATFADGWSQLDTAARDAAVYSKTFPTDPTGPDELEPVRPKFWPQHVVAPFHYPNPVRESKLAAP